MRAGPLRHKVTIETPSTVSDLGVEVESKAWDKLGSIVIGTDGNDYACIVSHTSATANKPTTGADYADVWEATGLTGRGSVWAAGESYYTGRVWAGIKPLKGLEYWNQRQSQSEVTHEIEVRYRSDVTAQERIVYGLRTFDIDAVINVDERKKRLLLMCVERTT
jgi:SPP1 family predicted phage head-tail adaptor